MEALLLPLGVFVLGAGLVLGAYYAATALPAALMRRRIESRLRDVGHHLQPETAEVFTLVKQQAKGAVPGLDRLAARTESGASLGRLIEQAGARVGPSTVIVASVVSGVLMGAVALLLVRVGWAVIPATALGLAVPFVVLLRKRARRLRRFEELFPEALDLLSRAIKAGHAFTTAMGMVADEAPNPIGPEFRKAFDEQNYGLPLRDALLNLMARVPLLDVRFFVTAVSIQRETGGNLSEILDNLSYVVRERFKILRQVRVYTAHGRLTGYVLMALPACLAIVLSFINADHMALLFDERMGRGMIAAAIVLQTIGYFWIRKVVKIEV